MTRRLWLRARRHDGLQGVLLTTPHPRLRSRHLPTEIRQPPVDLVLELLAQPDQVLDLKPLLVAGNHAERRTDEVVEPRQEPRLHVFGRPGWTRRRPSCDCLSAGSIDDLPDVLDLAALGPLAPRLHGPLPTLQRPEANCTRTGGRETGGPRKQPILDVVVERRGECARE